MWLNFPHTVCNFNFVFLVLPVLFLVSVTLIYYVCGLIISGFISFHFLGKYFNEYSRRKLASVHILPIFMKAMS